jgi:hypothetical protein
MRTVTNEPDAARSGDPSRARSPGHRGVHQPLLQACFTSVGVAALLAVATVTGASGSRIAPPDAVASGDVTTPVWRESWSERFPGCVAMVLWPGTERPVALVTRSPGGELRRLDVGSDQRVPVSDRAVGACR